MEIFWAIFKVTIKTVGILFSGHGIETDYLTLLMLTEITAVTAIVLYGDDSQDETQTMILILRLLLMMTLTTI